jgi:folate-dependent tRNA-U54 methylase TrmFO/GidA
MTKSEALNQWKTYRLPAIQQAEQLYGNGYDRPMRREDWNNYTDALCKSGAITLRQYETWTHPRIVDPD